MWAVIQDRRCRLFHDMRGAIAYFRAQPQGRLYLLSTTSQGWVSIAWNHAPRAKSA
jgi:hypothetical protein